MTGRPDVGLTPKFTIRDARGDVYLIKLDPADYPELPSSVEVISTKIFHAIGYHVPEDFIVNFDPVAARVAPGAKMRTESGKQRRSRTSDIARWLKTPAAAADGRIRALASRYVPGTVVGTFQFTGTRSDDPNDIFPHERRRELRGLRVFAAWLNHDDARSLNSIDAYVEEDGRRYIRHYLQDFGSNLGSGSTSAQQPRGGYEYLIERGPMLKGLAGLRSLDAGLDGRAKYPHRSVARQHRGRLLRAGELEDRISAAGIRSDGCRRCVLGRQPRLALHRSDDSRHRRRPASSPTADAARVLDRHHDQAAGQGRRVLDFANQSARPVRVDVERSARRWPSTMRPSRSGVAQPGASYIVSWSALDNMQGIERALGAGVFARDRRIAIPMNAWGPRDDNGDRYAVARIQTFDPAFPEWEKPVTVTIRHRGAEMGVVGIERPSNGPLRGLRPRS